MRLDLRARQSLVRVNAARYQKASKKEKGKILDEFVESTGYRRCYGSLLLNRHGRSLRVDRKTTLIGDISKRVRKKREPIYGPDVLEAVKKIWANLDFLCGKRLKAVLSETLGRMERWGEIEVSSSTRQKLKRISAATIDRLLVPERKRLELKSRSGTKPGTLLRSQIQIRTSSDWDENRPGFGEIDLVSHGGGDERGDFAQSLCFTDIASTGAMRWQYATKRSSTCLQVCRPSVNDCLLSCLALIRTTVVSSSMLIWSIIAGSRRSSSPDLDRTAKMIIVSWKKRITRWSGEPSATCVTMRPKRLRS